MARYRLTPKRKRSILKAQRRSVLMRYAINKTADTLTKGGASKATNFFRNNERRSKRSRKAKRKAARRRRRG